MSTYVRIWKGSVAEVIPPFTNAAGQLVPIEARYTPEFVASLVDVTGLNPAPAQGWAYDGSKFAPPGAAETQ